MTDNSNTNSATVTKTTQLVQQTLQFYEKRRTMSLGSRESTNSKNYANFDKEQSTTKAILNKEWQQDRVPANKMKRTRESPNDNNRNAKKNARDTEFVLKTSNRYNVLSAENVFENESSSEQQNEIKIPKPEPIFATGVNNIHELVKILDAADVKENYMLTTMKAGHMVKLMPKDIESYKTIRELFLEKDISHYTYQLKHEKCYRVVLRGMHHSEDITNIKDAIEILGHQVRNIVNARHRVTKEPLPLFYVDLEPSHNNKNIFEIKHLNHTIVTFEPPYIKKEIVQCKRCQRFGHTKNFCHRPFRCVKCGENHATISCMKRRDIPAVCVHCNENHPANYRGCKIYKEYKRQVYEPKTKGNIPTHIESQSNPQKQYETAKSSSYYPNKSYAQATKENTNFNTVPVNEMLPGQQDILPVMNQMLSKFEKTIEGLMEKMLDRMFDLIMSIVNKK